MAYIDTPRTDAGNATYLDHGKGIDDVSMEMSFVSPKKRQGDLVSQMRGKGTAGLRTPSTRRALLDRPNIAKRGGAGEFTPLMKSAKKIMAQRGKENVHALKTPAFLRTLHEADEAPGLPVSESSAILVSDSDNTDMALQHAGARGLPHANSSSIMSTPMIHTGKGDRMLEDQKNLMTLREQENIINKTEKENFGLKLKIHFLEEMLANSDPNLNQEAIKQNTDLRVDRATLQRELNKVKKQLQNSGRDAEALRQQLLDDQAKVDQQVADKRLRTELTTLRETVQTKDQEIEKLQDQLDSSNKTQEVANLKGQIEDLEAELREKERIIDTQDDDKEARHDNQKGVSDLQQELDEAYAKIDELKEFQLHNDELQEATLQARQDVSEAEEGKRRAERECNAAIEDGKEQVKEAQTQFRALREKYDILKEGFRTKSQTIQDLEQELVGAKAKARTREQELVQKINTLQQQQEEPLLSNSLIEQRLQEIIRQLNAKTDEKDLLQTRHDALTDESRGLQRDLSRVQSENSILQGEIDNERQKSLDTVQYLKEEHRSAEEKLESESSRLRALLEVERNRVHSTEDAWQDKYQKLEAQKDALKQRSTRLEKTIERLQRSEGNLSTREGKMEIMLTAEKKRHEDEEKLLQQQLRDTQANLQEKRANNEEYRVEVAALKEDIKLHKRDLDQAVQKHEALEDEIVVMQSSVDEDSEYAKQEVIKLKNEIQNHRTQLSSGKAEILRLKSELEHSHRENHLLEEDVRTRSAKKHDTTSQFDRLKQTISNLQSENHVLSTQLNEAQESITQLQSQVQLERKDLSFFRHEQDEKETRITQMEAEKRALSRSLSTAQEQIKSLEAQRASERNDFSHLRHNQKESHGKLSELESEKSSLSKQLRLAQDQIEDFKLQIQSERNSQSLSEHERVNQDSKISELQTDKRLLSERLTQALARITELDGLLVAEHNGLKREDVRLNGHDLGEHGVRESKFLNRETSYKIEIARLEEKISDLYGQLRNNQALRTPARSPVLASLATPNEIADLRKQLEEARRHSREYRDQIQELEKKARKAASSYAKVSNDHDGEIWKLRRDLEKKTHDLEAGQAELDKIHDAVDKSTTKLRTRIQELEKDAQQARLTQVEDDTIANERQDLHDMIKSAKLDAENLRAQLNDNQVVIKVSEEREQSLRATIQHVREERSEQQQCVAALTKQLAKLQDQYDAKVEEIYRQGPQIETTQAKDKKTIAEMRGLAKQIEWLKQNLNREKSFRQALSYEKHYYLQQIDMYNAW